MPLRTFPAIEQPRHNGSFRNESNYFETTRIDSIYFRNDVAYTFRMFNVAQKKKKKRQKTYIKEKMK